MDPTTWQAPLGVVVGALFVIVMARANGTYWLGRAMLAGTRRTRWRRLLETRGYQVGAKFLNRWGPAAVTLSFLTIGIQTMVNLAAGISRMPLRRYLPAVILGCVIWAFMYGTVGFVGFLAIKELWAWNPALTIALGVVAVVLVAVSLLYRGRSKAQT
ncbi:MAG: DedA family protein [Arachnia sp.]